ncbi:hypothetical protein [Dactylosporangium sp. NPDC051484]|uniref:hypothetical protein n=1 Tax=Dactylosporangium sp. NPDC051484 TaxID=3154942 RepID=UPI00344CD314
MTVTAIAAVVILAEPALLLYRDAGPRPRGRRAAKSSRPLHGPGPGAANQAEGPTAARGSLEERHRPAVRQADTLDDIAALLADPAVGRSPGVLALAINPAVPRRGRARWHRLRAAVVRMTRAAIRIRTLPRWRSP